MWRRVQSPNLYAPIRHFPKGNGGIDIPTGIFGRNRLNLGDS
jgi:hypothetical protein